MSGEDPSPSPSPPARFDPINRWLTGPGASRTEAQLRRARLLGWLLVVDIGSTLAALGATWLTNAPASQRLHGYVALLVALLVGFGVALIANHRGRYGVAAGTAVAAAVAGPWVSWWLDGGLHNTDLVPLAYVVLPILLSSVLLSARSTAVVGGLQLAPLL